MNSCAVAVQRKDDEGDNRWLSIHQRFIAECREKDPEVIFVGDCILETLQDTETWHKYFAPMHCLNFSIRGDRTENVLWRVENGELDNVKPKVIVLHVGTNNIGDDANDIANGIYEIIVSIRTKLPNSYIVIPTLLPRGHKPNLLREKNAQVNIAIYKKVLGLKRVQIVNIGNGLIQRDGSISHHDMFDYKNLTNTGARKVFEPVYDVLSQILNDTE